MLSSLRGCKFSGKDDLIYQLRSLDETITDADKLCVILQAFSQLGLDMYCLQTEKKIEAARKKILDSDKPTHEAWLQASMLLAANHLSYREGHDSLQDIGYVIKKLDAKHSPTDKYAAWSWSALATLNQKQYVHTRMKMQSSAESLKSVYDTINSDDRSPQIRNNALSTVIWTLVYTIQAAAHAGDNILYFTDLATLKEITKQDSIGLALKNGLLPDASPALAIATIRLAAATIEDKKVFDDLEPYFNEALNKAIANKETLEHASAKVCNQLATERYIQFLRAKDARLMQLKNRSATVANERIKRSTGLKTIFEGDEERCQHSISKN